MRQSLLAPASLQHDVHCGLCRWIKAWLHQRPDGSVHVPEALRSAEQAGHGAMEMSLESLLASAEEENIVRLAPGREPGDDEAEDEFEDGDGGPRGYKDRLLAILGLAWLAGR